MSSNEKAPPKPTHTLADHVFGDTGAHAHGPDADHDHDDFEPGPLEENAFWIRDNIWLTSVGIDIGSAGTQIIFSRLHLRRLGEDLSSRYTVVERETLYQSPVALTPYRSEERIDERTLGEIIDDAYEAAGLQPEEIDAGVVILTGEALRRENAEAIAGIVAAEGGDFVCATAGHHMESLLAAYGSGAARVSHDMKKRILNVDIGGGTTKLAVVEGGRVAATAALHIGGRLMVVDSGGRIVRLDPAGQHLAAEAGFAWKLGDTVAKDEMERVAAWMADALIAALCRRPLPREIEKLLLTAPLGDAGPIEGMMFSGGVAEFIYGRETRDFGDMGRLLGSAVRRKIDSGVLPWPLLPAGECIRATALGASEYSVQLSGNTIYVSDPKSLLPRRNLQVLQPNFDCSGDLDPERLAQAIRAHFAAFDLIEGTSDAALAFRWQGAPSYARLSAFAAGIAKGLANSVAAEKPLYLVLDGDIAQMLGHLLREEMGVKSPLLVIDGIVLWDFDYIDIGRIRLPSYTVPVTVKSLVFNADPRAAAHQGHQHTHHYAHRHHHHGDQHQGHSHSTGGLSVREVFERADLKPSGPVSWGSPVPEKCPGVYVVSLVEDPAAPCDRLDVLDLSDDELARWLPCHPVIYIGRASGSISKRVSQFYRHRYSRPAPHRGGQAVKLLSHNLWVFWAATDKFAEAERRMLNAFVTHSRRLPFANRRLEHGKPPLP
jgi:ethanolamine utilization protein EutA